MGDLRKKTTNPDVEKVKEAIQLADDHTIVNIHIAELKEARDARRKGVRTKASRG